MLDKIPGFFGVSFSYRLDDFCMRLDGGVKEPQVFFIALPHVGVGLCEQPSAYFQDFPVVGGFGYREVEGAVDVEE